jgi:hypothetical protein
VVGRRGKVVFVWLVVGERGIWVVDMCVLHEGRWRCRQGRLDGRSYTSIYGPWIIHGNNKALIGEYVHTLPGRDSYVIDDVLRTVR